MLTKILLVLQTTRNGTRNSKQTTKGIDKANEFSETLYGTITSFIKDSTTQRQIVDELNRIDVKTSRGHEFQLTTLQRDMKRLGVSTLHNK